jgi:hypothetical protein
VEEVMPKFEVEYRYTVPEYNYIEIEAEDDTAARELADDAIRDELPWDYDGFEIVDVTELD